MFSAKSRHLFAICKFALTRHSSASSNADYLRKWLGSDLSGESYLEQLVKANRIPTKPSSTSSSVVTNIQPNHNPNYAPHLESSLDLSSESDVIFRSESISLTKKSVHIIAFSVNLLHNPPIASTLLDHIEADVNSFVDSSSVSLIQGSNIVIDLDFLADYLSTPENHKDVVDIVTDLIDVFKTKGLHVVGFYNVPQSIEEKVQQATNLSNLAIGSPIFDSAPEKHSLEASVANSGATINESKHSNSVRVSHSTAVGSSSSMKAAAKVHSGTVRSGQQIYGEMSPLVVIGTVNSGGEVLADGDIHVYGALNGRALAGLGGSSGSDSSARIFTSSFNAALVGINDTFIVPDDFPELSRVIGKAVCVHIDDETSAGATASATGHGAAAAAGIVVSISCEAGGAPKRMVFTVIS